MNFYHSYFRINKFKRIDGHCPCYSPFALNLCNNQVTDIESEIEKWKNERKQIFLIISCRHYSFKYMIEKEAYSYYKTINKIIKQDLNLSNAEKEQLLLKNENFYFSFASYFAFEVNAKYYRDKIIFDDIEFIEELEEISNLPHYDFKKLNMIKYKRLSFLKKMREMYLLNFLNSEENSCNLLKNYLKEFKRCNENLQKSLILLPSAA